VVVDDGNASPHLIRSEMYAIPKEKSILREVLGEDSSIGFISTPMAIPSANVPVYQTSQLPEELRLSHIAIDGTSVKSKPPRCAYCHAYANPFWNHAKCNFCTRINRSACPPLASQLGTVEYPVDGPYVTRSPVKPNIIYAIDATAPSCEQYVRLLAKDVIPKIAQHAQLQQQNRRDPPRVRVGIVLAASSGIYIPSLSGIEPRFVVMPDIKQEPYSPLPLSEWTFDICEDVGKMKMFLSALLNSLVPQLIKERVRVHNTIGPGNGNHHPPYQLSCGGAAMAFMVDALKNTGGRAVWISWRRPNCGVGSLKDRERANSEKKEHITGKAPFLSDPNNKFYKKLTERCQKSRIALDVVLHTNPTVPKSFLDVATLGQLCQATNGNLLRICAPAAVWESCLASSLTKIVSCVSGWDCILKIRCSTGLRIHSFQGNGVGKIVNSKNLTNDSPDLELPVVQQDTCIGFNLEHRVGGVPKQDSFVFVQTALLYTNIWTGERRVRVSTLGLRTANNPAACFPSLDFGTIVASELRAVSAGLQNGETNFSTKKKILDQCVKILALYRKATKNDPLLSQSQLVLPEKLRLYPLIVLSMLKSPLLRKSVDRRSHLSDPRPDDRALYLYQACRISPIMALLLVHPLLFCIPSNDDALPWKTLPSSDGTLMNDLKHAPYVEMPEALSPTISNLDDDKVYLMDTCFAFYVLIEKNVPVDRTKRLDINSGPLGRAITQLRQYSQVKGSQSPSVNWQRPIHTPVIVVNSQESSDKAFYDNLLKWMVVDSTSAEKNLMDFHVDLHRRVQQKM
jgi:protein transport protein SEC24